MTTKPHIWALAAAVGLAGASLDAAAGRIKCWTNKEGVRECGNAVPPEYAQKGHEELNELGLTVEKQERAKTAEELAAERRAQETALERERAERERAAAAAARDRVLLDTFTTEEDLRLANEGKLQAIESRIAHSERVIEKLHATLEQLQSDAARLERSGKPVPDATRADIRQVQRQIEDNRGFIAERRKEQEALRVQFDEDLERYRQLKGGG